MPELPDLEIFAANLEKQFKNKKLERLEVIVAKKLNVTEKELQEAFIGRKLEAVLREGKTLQLHFEGGVVLGLHLMLHGAIRLLEQGQETKFKIIEFWFKGEQGFALTDFQKQATPTFNPEKSEVPDALSKDFSITYFKGLNVGGLSSVFIGVPLDVINLITQQFRVTLAISYHQTGTYQINFDDFFKIVASTVKADTKLALSKNIMEEVAEKMVLTLGSKTSQRLVPIVGGVIGGTVNYFFIKGVAKSLLHPDQPDGKHISR